MSTGEVAKDTFEDLAVLAMHMRRGRDGDRALEAILNRVGRAVANPGSDTALGLMQGMGRFMAVRYPLRSVEGNED